MVHGIIVKNYIEPPSVIFHITIDSAIMTIYGYITFIWVSRISTNELLLIDLDIPKLRIKMSYTHVSSPETKYYFADVGIRAAILNYRQQEETHIMENIIYNELRSRGYNVDVGLVELGGKDENGKFVRKQLEVDFVVNRPPYRVYIQSAFHMPTPEKEQQERRPLLSINDHFRKIVIVGDDIHRKEDELGVLTVGLLDFLTDKDLLEQG